jgi:hypothetical protein
VRLARAPLDAALPDEAVAFETQEMSADGVVRQPELFSQLGDGAGLAAQQTHDAPACAVKKTLVKFSRHH